MTAVIRYKPPYIVEGCSIFIVSFALKYNVSLRCVLKLPTLLVIEGVIIFFRGIFLHIIQSEISLYFRLTG